MNGKILQEGKRVIAFWVDYFFLRLSRFFLSLLCYVFQISMCFNQNFCKKNKLFYHWLADRFYAYYVRLFKRYFVFFGTVVRTSLPAFYFN